MELLIIIFTICILTNKNSMIIKDSGLISFLCISTGCLFKLYSNNYIITEKTKYCYLNLLFSYIGFMLIYIPFTIKILIASNFLLKFKQNHKHDKILINNIFSKDVIKNMFQRKNDASTKVMVNTFDTLPSDNYNDYSGSENDIKENKITGNNINIPKVTQADSVSSTSQLNKQNILVSTAANSLPSIPQKIKPILSTTNSTTSIPQKNNKQNPKMTAANSEPSITQNSIITNIFDKFKLIKSNKKLTSKEKFYLVLRMTYIEIQFTISLFFIFFIPIFVYIISIKNESLIDKQMYNNLYSKECPTSRIPVSIVIVEFIMLLYHISKIKTIYNGKYILKENKLITLISIVWIFLDPGINVKYILKFIIFTYYYI